MDDIKTKLLHMTKQGAVAELKKKYEHVISLLPKGVYIWGTGFLGKFVNLQCEKNDVQVHGYIDNNQDNLNKDRRIFSCDVLKKDDVVIIASFYCADIIEQLDSLNIKNYIYYEELACVMQKFDIYYQAFKGIHEELEAEKMQYMHLYDLLEDNTSKEVYTAIINYRISLDTAYATKAYNISLPNGTQYFDKVVIDKLDPNVTFFDVGGFDGESTEDFIKRAGAYRKIYFFEPDQKVIEKAKKRLRNNKDIEFIQAGVGEKKGAAHYDAVGNGSGNITEAGTEIVQIVALDDYIDQENTYVKMDVEGYEMQVLQGMKRTIKRYKPMLAVSVYHKCGDMHKLLNTILAWNPNYKIYMRHYTKNYADTVCYFIDCNG